jgi:hypothetical protein
MPQHEEIRIRQQEDASGANIWPRRELTGSRRVHAGMTLTLQSHP